MCMGLNVRRINIDGGTARSSRDMVFLIIESCFMVHYGRAYLYNRGNYPYIEHFLFLYRNNYPYIVK
jgi:hypothetical protein